MFSPEGPTLRELAVQALSSVEHGYDLLAPKFDHTPYRTPDRVLDAVASALADLGPFGAGLDLCCGTGAGVDVLSRVCRDRVTGVDFSAGMLAVARQRAVPEGPAVSWVRADARALPFGPAFDLVVSFGAFGHFLPRELPGLFGQVRSVLRPGGCFAFPVYKRQVLPHLPARRRGPGADPCRVPRRTAGAARVRPPARRQSARPAARGPAPVVNADAGGVSRPPAA